MSQDHRLAFIKALRDCANFLEQHPSVPAPWNAQLNVFPNDRATLAHVARQASWEKDYSLDGYFSLIKRWGSSPGDEKGVLTLEMCVNRETVCRKVITGTRIVPAQPERIVEDYDWVCDDASLLAGGE